MSGPVPEFRPRPGPVNEPENVEALVLRNLREMVFMGTPVKLAANLAVGGANGRGELPGVLLVLQGGEDGLFVQLTPEGARKVASELISAAAKVEAEGLARVRSALGALGGNYGKGRQE